MLGLFGLALSTRSSALPLRQLHTGQQLRRCCGPRAALSEAEEAASLEAFAVEVQAEAAAARSPSAMALCREAADAEVAQLQASGDVRLVELLEASQAVSSGDVLRALRKPEGTISIVAEGVPVAAGSKPTGTPGTLCSGWLDADLADASWLSEQFRIGGATAVCASVRLLTRSSCMLICARVLHQARKPLYGHTCMHTNVSMGQARLSATAVADMAREQQGASGNFPGPAPVVARAGFVHPLQLARAARDGAAAVGPAARPRGCNRMCSVEAATASVLYAYVDMRAYVHMHRSSCRST